jgi:hypothetical protein
MEYSKNKIDQFSVENILINEKFLKIFKNTTIYAWNINDKKEYNRLENLGVQNICTDIILP